METWVDQPKLPLLPLRFWINDNHSGFSTVYNSDGSLVSTVAGVPPAGGGKPPGSPTGIVYNGSTNFQVAPGLPARFIFATEDGTISGWNAGTNAVLKVDRSAEHSVYKGLAIANLNGTNFLYAADFFNNSVDVFDDHFNRIEAQDQFVDPALPIGFAPFGIRAIAGLIYVTYARQDADKQDDVAGAGNGIVNVFLRDGQFVRRFASGGLLNSPWGIAMAPAGFGTFGGALLIGNFGDGTIQAFNPSTGRLLGRLLDAEGFPIRIEGLWDLAFGNGGRAGDTGRLYFVAGIAGVDSVEDHGLFGNISAVPSVRITQITRGVGTVQIQWTGRSAPYLIQHKADLNDSHWTDLKTTTETFAELPAGAFQGFFRVRN